MFLVKKSSPDKNILVNFEKIYVALSWLSVFYPTEQILSRIDINFIGCIFHPVSVTLENFM